MEPGIVVAALNRQVAEHHLHYAPDPSTVNRATVGGGIGNNSCGTHSVLFGKTIDQVLELDTILSDSTRARLGPISPSGLEYRLSGPGCSVTPIVRPPASPRPTAQR